MKTKLNVHKKTNTKIERLWNEPTPGNASVFLRGFLHALSIPYRGGVFLRNSLYDKHMIHSRRLPCPVISVGNMTVGGTGKTPTVITIAAWLKQQGYHPAVLSRGYGGKAGGNVNVVSDGKNILMGWREAGDEPVLMAKSLPAIPVLTGAERFFTGRTALEQFGSDVLILDDAFQHRQLFRDIDLVLIDGERPFGNGFHLPRGPLRESPYALHRADMLLKTGGTEKGEFLPVDSALPAFRGIHKPIGVVSGKTGQIDPSEVLQGEKIIAFSGIGAPDSFVRGLASLGADVVSSCAFPDHHPYSSSDIDDLRLLANRNGATRLITTEKDGIRLTDFPDFMAEVSFLRISMEITPFAQFAELLLSRIVSSS
jgi:tetraacyldisaccharide 4'-kinase